MKIAITSTGTTLGSTIDPRFGRAAYFVIYDIENKSFEICPNPNKEATEGAGPASVQFVAEKGVEKIVSGEFGVKVKDLLDSLKIQMIAIKDHSKTVQEIIDMLNQNK
ncbi:MAG: NifB/NifX family molybdenum-iron cluster-binding protein [Bacteroidota bacterium]|jgi:predicted Fe-Mo cluster-binding NifX family protein|nr:NifB/NifX family molybdenum-iron cluster-binding protein [Bacteroidota bacterium]NLP20060.1 dinitrogenase iron-molybdenum cofactor biosynthesis protein [Bacteroidales bacterium]OQC46881.1 MAG: Dinitrogenase iron-molybdenum cofactor [Bacteroidetes bacterium ADurb.Bin028]HNY44765.1 NifB/NifX family molybdenum-iron cluster-binding protein [Bacteroidales bacterium]HOD87894.1 NifB/NifX family molybdenum-iron cluster-binding protein [Bacteroidales bacterium]